MKKARVLSLILSAALAFALIPIVNASAAEDRSAIVLPLSVTDPLPEGNLIEGGDFDNPSCTSRWDARKQTLRHVLDENGGYIECSDITINYRGFRYTPKATIGPGTYKFTGYIRMKEPGEVTGLRVMFYDTDGNNTGTNYAYPTNEWLKVEYYLILDNNLSYITVCGGTSPEFTQSYCLDNFSLVKVDSVPSDAKASWGTPVTGQQAYDSNIDNPVFSKWDAEADSVYNIDGLIINQDANSFTSSVTSGKTTEADIINFAKQFKSSHITDYMICINNTNATFPSETWTDDLDKFYEKEENGKAVDYSTVSTMLGAHHIFETLGTDYISLWMTAFREIGINPWLSVRMNDAHDTSLETSCLLSKYFHDNPEIRRVRHGSTTNTYFDNIQDYTFDSVRDHMLDLINEALNRYDTFGLELDWQREMWLWHTGGEYNGLDILNDFMRDVDALVRIYEKKYNHEIKIGVRVASNLETNYDFGLDVMTWVAEGIVDMVCPSGRWETTDNDIPVRLWASMLAPYGVTLAPCIETNIKSHDSGGAATGGHTIETLAGAAANILSQGADKVYIFNYYRVLSNSVGAADRISTTDTRIGVTTPGGYWNVITSVGSYDKLMTLDRRVILTYNDLYQTWRTSNAQLPKSMMPGDTVTLRIPMGDVPNGASVIFKFSVDTDGPVKDNPSVYVNSKKCTYIGSEECAGGYTKQKLICYSVPAEAHGKMYAVIEITTNQWIYIDYAEIYIDAVQ